MESRQTNSHKFRDELRTRCEKLNSYYFIYALTCVFIGGIGVWAPLVFDMSAPGHPHLIPFITYGFAMSGGMLVNELLNWNRNGQLAIVGFFVLFLALAMLLNPYTKGGPYPALTYVGTVLILAVWFLANVHEYESRVLTGAEFAKGAKLDHEIPGRGLDIDD